MAFLLVFLGIMVSQLFLARSGKKDVRPLPGGGTIRLHSVSAGTTHVMQHPAPPFSERLRRCIQSRSFAPLGERGSHHIASSGSRPGLCIWVLVEGARSVELVDPTLVLPDGQTFLSRSSGSFSAAAFVDYSEAFPFLPYTAEKLHFTVRISGETFDWEFDNPAYQPGIDPKPEPLPQTRKTGSYEIRLDSLELRKSGFDPYTVPKFAVLKNGKTADGLSVGWKLRDAAGNEFYGTGLTSSKTWMMVPRLRRAGDFPFEEGEVTWVGEITPEILGFEPGRAQDFPVPPAAISGGVLRAAVLSPGAYKYSVSADVFESTPPAGGKLPSGLSLGYDGKALSLEVSKTSLVLLTKNAELVVVSRDAEGRPVPEGSSMQTGFDGTTTVIVHPLGAEFRKFGVASSIIEGVKDDSVSFLVAPPALTKP